MSSFPWVALVRRSFHSKNCSFNDCFQCVTECPDFFLQLWQEWRICIYWGYFHVAKDNAGFFKEQKFIGANLCTAKNFRNTQVVKKQSTMWRVQVSVSESNAAASALQVFIFAHDCFQNHWVSSRTMVIKVEHSCRVTAGRYTFPAK